MSLPQNLRPSTQFVKCADGQSKQLLVYEAKLMDIMKGPMMMLGSTIGNMLHFMYLKAQTPEDRLLVKMLMEKVIAEYLATAGCITLIIDDKLDVMADIEKNFNEILKKRKESPPVNNTKDSSPKPDPHE